MRDIHIAFSELFFYQSSVGCFGGYERRLFSAYDFRSSSYVAEDRANELNPFLSRDGKMDMQGMSERCPLLFLTMSMVISHVSPRFFALGISDFREDIDIIDIDTLFRKISPGSRITNRTPDSVLSCLGQTIAILVDVFWKQTGPTASIALQSSAIVEDLRYEMILHSPKKLTIVGLL